MQFHVQNMTCGSCVRHVTEAISKIDPAAKIEADVRARKITVLSTAGHEEIEKALANDGYAARLV